MNTNSNKHFCDVPPERVPKKVPRTCRSKKDGVDYTLVGAWFYPPRGDAPAVLKVRYDGPIDPETKKPRKEMRPYHKLPERGWVCGLGKHRPSLYGISSIRPGEPCFVVEGEKAAAALHSIGVSAVGLPGTSMAATIDLSPLDDVADVILWPDNDKSGVGVESMNTISSRLKRVHRRITPDLLSLPPKGDAADLIREGNIPDPEALRVRITPAFVDVAGPPPLLEVLPPNWHELGVPPRSFVFEEARVPSGCVTLLSAAGGSGKSFLLLTLAVSVCIGRELLKGWKPMRQGKVVMVSIEDDIEEVTRRLLCLLRAFGFGHAEADMVSENLRFVCNPQFSIIGPSRQIVAGEEFLDFCKELKEFSPAFLTIDPLAAVLGGLDENDNPTAQCVVGLLRDNVPSTTGIMLATHTSKLERMTGGSARGAGGWSDASRQAWSIRPLDKKERACVEYDPDAFVCLQHLKSNYGPMHEDGYFRRCGRPDCGGVLESVDFEQMKKAALAYEQKALADAVLETLTDFPVTRQELKGDIRGKDEAAESARERSLAFIEALAVRMKKTVSRDERLACADMLLSNGRIVKRKEGKRDMLVPAASQEAPSNDES